MAASSDMATQTLHGSCACGRNRYVIEIPPQQVRQAELRYDNTPASRKLTDHPSSHDGAVTNQP